MGYQLPMSKVSKTFRIEEDVVERLENQATEQARSISNLVHGYLEDRVGLAKNWPAFDRATYDQIKAWLTIPQAEREEILARRKK